MILTDAWVGITTAFLITGFFVGWRRGRLIYRSQIPPAQPANTLERLVAAIENRVAPPEPAPEKKSRQPIVPFAVVFAQTWGLWMLSGQIMYWGVKLIHAIAYADLTTPLVWAVNHWWLLPVTFPLAALMFIAIRFYMRSDKSEGDMPHLTPAPAPQPGHHLTPFPPQPVPDITQPQPAMGYSEPAPLNWARPSE